MRPYTKNIHRDAPHPNGAPTPKHARSRAAKRTCRQQGQAECRQLEG